MTFSFPHFGSIAHDGWRLCARCWWTRSGSRFPLGAVRPGCVRQALEKGKNMEGAYEKMMACNESFRSDGEKLFV